MRENASGTRLLRESLRGCGRTVAGLLAWSVLESAPALSAGLVMARAVDSGFLAGHFGVGVAWLGLLGALYAVQTGAEWALFPYFADIIEPMRDRLVRRVVRGTIERGVRGQVHHNSPADAAGVARLTRHVEAVRGLFGALLRTVRPVAVTLLAALAGLATLAPALLPLVLPPLLLALAGYPLTVRLLSRRRRRVALADERVAEVTGRVLLGVRDVTTLGAEDVAVKQIQHVARQHARQNVSLAWAGAARVLLDVLGGHLPVLLVLLAGPTLLRGAVSPGELVGAVTYLIGHLTPALRSLTGTVSGYLTQLTTTLTRLAETTEIPPEKSTVDTPPSGQHIALRGVTFAYGAAATPVVDALNLDIPAGEHLAIVGASGIGKSTLAALLAGLDTPGAGSVRVGGVDPAALETATRRDTVAFVPQQAYVFPGTVRENLCYVATDVTDADLDAAVDALGVRPLLERLGGYDAVLTDPAGELSAGERQQLALLRTYLSPARVIILDEAGCQLDPGAERAAELAFARRGGTLIVVAHRVSSARRAERVLLLHAGGHAVGTATELAATCPEYAAILRDRELTTV